MYVLVARYIRHSPDPESGFFQLVLDEGDTLLDMGFRPDIDAIADFFPKTPIRQPFLFSATVSPAIRQVARELLDKDHVFIDVVTKDTSPVHAPHPATLYRFTKSKRTAPTSLSSNRARPAYEPWQLEDHDLPEHNQANTTLRNSPSRVI